MSEKEPIMGVVKDADKQNNIEIIATDKLLSLIERIERLEEEKSTLSTDVKEVFGEAKSAGFDTRVMRLLIKMRKMDASELDEQEMLIETYRRAIGL